MAGRLLLGVAAIGAGGVLALALAAPALGIYHGGDPPPPPDDGAEAAEVRAGPQPNTFDNPQVTIDRGDELFFRNNDRASPEQHNVTSLAGPGRLFRSATIPAGQRVPVRGVEELDPGRYRFLCTLHPAQMQGVLTVRGAILGLQIRPRRAGVRAPGVQRYRATVRNRGDAVTPNPVRVCANAPQGINVRGKACRGVGTLAPGATAQMGFRVRATRRASRGRNRIGFAARSPGSRNAQARAVLRVRR
jgi:plastocyanin